MTEGELCNRIIRKLRGRYGGFWFRVVNQGDGAMMRGLPDIVYCFRGSFGGLEIKLPGKRGEVSASQRLVASKIFEAGGYVDVVTSVEEADKVFRQTFGYKPERGP